MPRKRNRLEHFDYSSCATYFITICTSDRTNYFWKNAEVRITGYQDVELTLCGKTVENAISKLSQIYPALSVEHYVIMPDHVHLLIRYCADEYGRAMHAPTNKTHIVILCESDTFLAPRMWQIVIFTPIFANRQKMHLKRGAFLFC